MSDAPNPTAEQILSVAVMIRAGHSDDQHIASHVGITAAAVARFREQGLGYKIKRKKSTKGRAGR